MRFQSADLVDPLPPPPDPDVEPQKNFPMPSALLQLPTDLYAQSILRIFDTTGRAWYTLLPGLRQRELGRSETGAVTGARQEQGSGGCAKEKWKMRKLPFTIFVAVCLLIGAGQMAPATWAQSPEEITGIQWQWAELTETEPASQSVVPNPENYVLVLNADGSASLKADCNMVAWTYTLEGTSLTFNTLGPSTLAFCGEESLDQQYLGLLGKGGTVSLENDRLVLELNDNAGRMVFNNGGPAETAPETAPETGGASVVVPWAATVLAGLAALGTGAALQRRKR
jgi:heat shock protein HslJ